MAAGLVTKTVGDGNGGTFTAQFWSSDGTGTGTLTPVQLTTGGSGFEATIPTAVTVTTSITRPADTTAYALNDTWADSTSAPTAGGFTLTSAARVSGGSGVITDLIITSSNDPATLLSAELWIFDSAGTAVNDNAAFALSDPDVLKLVGVIPFVLQSTTGGSGTNSYAALSNVNLGFACSGSADLRFLIKVKNVYTPASAEVLTVRAKIIRSN